MYYFRLLDLIALAALYTTTASLYLVFNLPGYAYILSLATVGWTIFSVLINLSFKTFRSSARVFFSIVILIFYAFLFGSYLKGIRESELNFYHLLISPFIILGYLMFSYTELNKINPEKENKENLDF